MPEYSYLCEKCNHNWSIVTSMSKYKDRIECPSCQETKNVYRNFAEDETYSAVSLALSEIKNLGHYADKQSKQYGKWKCEDMAQEFVTKKVEGGGELPDGMSRIERPAEAPDWPGSTKKKRKSRRKK